MTDILNFENSLLEEGKLSSLKADDLFEEFKKLSVNKKKNIARENSIVILNHLVNESYTGNSFL